MEGDLDLNALATEGMSEEEGDEAGGVFGGDVFADADEFAHLIEEGMSEDPSLKRQMAWEERPTAKRQKGTGKGQRLKQRGGRNKVRRGHPV